jgi:anti-anti-sigma regulatory factor
MLKITIRPDARSTRLELEGRLVGPWVKELDRCWHTVSDVPPGDLIVDLTAVTYVDAEGKQLLTSMWQQGAKLHAAGCLTRCIVEEITKSGRPG